MNIVYNGAMDPRALLERGYLLASLENGRRIVSVNDLPDRGKIKLLLADGTVEMDVAVVHRESSGKDE